MKTITKLAIGGVALYLIVRFLKKVETAVPVNGLEGGKTTSDPRKVHLLRPIHPRNDQSALNNTMPAKVRPRRPRREISLLRPIQADFGSNDRTATPGQTEGPQSGYSFAPLDEHGNVTINATRSIFHTRTPGVHDNDPRNVDRVSPQDATVLNYVEPGYSEYGDDTNTDWLEDEESAYDPATGAVITA